MINKYHQRIITKIADFFVREDKEYTNIVQKNCAITKKEKTKYLLLYLAPGFVAFIFIYFLRLPVMNTLGMSSMTFQAIVLLTMTLGWQIGYPFYVLMIKDKLTLSETLLYLGFKKIDLKGILLILPIFILAYTIILAPFLYSAYPAMFSFFNDIPFLHMGEWHVFELNYGYDYYPLPFLFVIAFANFFGEEIYFRGFLLNKTDAINGKTLINNALFMVYHMWQIPVNWPFILISPIIPMAYLTKLRKNIYVAILFHIFVNFAWFSFTDFLFAGKI